MNLLAKRIVIQRNLPGRIWVLVVNFHVVKWVQLREWSFMGAVDGFRHALPCCSPEFVVGQSFLYSRRRQRRYYDLEAIIPKVTIVCRLPE